MPEASVAGQPLLTLRTLRTASFVRDRETRPLGTGGTVLTPREMKPGARHLEEKLVPDRRGLLPSPASGPTTSQMARQLRFLVWPGALAASKRTASGPRTR
jgi:hypothetical protein